jgi:hypothetical protein
VDYSPTREPPAEPRRVEVEHLGEIAVEMNSGAS